MNYLHLPDPENTTQNECSAANSLISLSPVADIAAFERLQQLILIARLKVMVSYEARTLRSC